MPTPSERSRSKSASRSRGRQLPDPARVRRTALAIAAARRPLPPGTGRYSTVNTSARNGSRLDGRLKVLNLASITSDGDLRTLFAEVGDVVDVNIMRDRLLGTCCGYGYVTMSALSEADSAVSRLNGRTLNGLPLEVGLFHPRVVHGWHSRGGTGRTKGTHA